MIFKFDIKNKTELMDLLTALSDVSSPICNHLKKDLEKFADDSTHGYYIRPDSMLNTHYHCPVCHTKVPGMMGPVYRCECGAFLSYDWIVEQLNLTHHTCIYQDQNGHGRCRHKNCSCLDSSTCNIARQEYGEQYLGHLTYMEHDADRLMLRNKYMDATFNYFDTQIFNSYSILYTKSQACLDRQRVSTNCLTFENTKSCIYKGRKKVTLMT